MNWIDAAGHYYKRTWSHEYELSVLPEEWQRELVALMLLDRDVNNGAYLQFYVNHGHVVYEYASRSLKTIGALRMAEIVDGCQSLIDEHSSVAGQSPSDRASLLANPIIGRDGQMVKQQGSTLPNSVLDRLYDLSCEFMNYPDDLGDLAQAHYGPLIQNDSLA